VSTLTLAEPLTAASFGVLLLDEPVTAGSVAGGALLLGALAALARSRPPAPDRADEVAATGVPA